MTSIQDTQPNWAGLEPVGKSGLAVAALISTLAVPAGIALLAIPGAWAVMVISGVLGHNIDYAQAWAAMGALWTVAVAGPAISGALNR